MNYLEAFLEKKRRASASQTVTEAEKTNSVSFVGDSPKPISINYLESFLEKKRGTNTSQILTDKTDKIENKPYPLTDKTDKNNIVSFGGGYPRPFARTNEENKPYPLPDKIDKIPVGADEENRLQILTDKIDKINIVSFGGGDPGTFTVEKNKPQIPPDKTDKILDGEIVGDETPSKAANRLNSDVSEYERAKAIARHCEKHHIDLATYLTEHVANAAAARVARLDRERNEADRIAGRGYDYDKSGIPRCFVQINDHLRVVVESDPEFKVCEICSEPAGLILPTVVNGRRRFCGTTCLARAKNEIKRTRRGFSN
jgi:hypothetical protein